MFEVCNEIKVAASPYKVWSVIGDFSAIADWHPACSASTSEMVNGKVQRTVTVSDGRRIVDQLQTLDHSAHRCTWTCLDAKPLQINESLVSLSVLPDGDGSIIRWTGRYDVQDDTIETAKQLLITDIHVMGLSALQKRFGSP